MVKGKKPTAEQRKVLVKNGYDPHEWIYISQKVEGDSGYRRLGKYEDKTTYLIFRNRFTNEELKLCV